MADDVPHAVDMTDGDQTDGARRKYPGTAAAAAPIQSLAYPKMEYKMDHQNRGICVIFNNTDFLPSTGQKKRVGSDTDAKRLNDSFTNLNFQVQPFRNTPSREMLRIMRDFASLSHTNADCFVCIVLSHGYDGVVFGTDDVVKIDDLVAPFKGNVCKSLCGKPKLFFIQACRGSKFDPGTEKTDGEGDDEPDSPNRPVPVRKIPIEADFFLAYSTVPGYFSWRNNQDGSWFIQCLVRVIDEHAKAGELELHHLMILVNRLVAKEYKSCSDSKFTDGMKQMPSMVSMLTKLLYFRNSGKAAIRH